MIPESKWFQNQAYEQYVCENGWVFNRATGPQDFLWDPEPLFF